MTNSRLSEVRVGILGAGYISKYHLEGLKTVPNARVVAISDLNRGRAQVVANMFSIPTVFTDLEAMLKDAHPDVVHVLLPPAAHADAVTRVLESGAHAFVEKPICLDEDELSRIRAAAERTGRHVGVGHNFLFADAYERLAADVRSGRLGRITRIDAVWDLELGPVRSGPFDGWLFAKPTNVLFEVGPHVFAYVVHLAGAARDLIVRADDWVTLPGGRLFAKRWEVLGIAGRASVRLRLGFGSGYPEHFVAVRGTSGVAIVDLNSNTYALSEHTAQMLDLDRFLMATRAATEVIAHSTATLGHLMLAKMGLKKVGTPYGRSIAACLRAFYEGLEQNRLDDRVADGVGGGAVELAIAVARTVTLPEPVAEAPLPNPPAAPAPSVLVLGGTGFLGRALVRRLREAGHGVRLLARHPDSVPRELRALGVEIVRGDFTDTGSMALALEGIQHIYHLARGDGSTWPEFYATDVEPTRRLGELCADSGIQGFYYTSSIAIYHAGRGGEIITEETPAHLGIARSNLYVRSKVENERNLLELHRTRGLPLVLFRPGIVIGRGGNPMHPGVTGWPYPSVSRLWGDGNHRLPIVLVDDCADAMVRALGRDDTHGLSFNLVGEPCLTARDYLDELERSTGLKVRRVPTSSMRYFAEEVAKYAIKTLGRDPNCRRPSYAEWAGRTCRAPFDASRAKQVLGWQPASRREVIVHEGIDIPARDYFG
jgi:predicted dehydrogenase/nucleoside-diphosphate-sugar epimerase